MTAAVAGRAIRVMVVDDHALFRCGVRALLRAAPGVELVGEAANGVEALRVAESCDPDVVLMDLEMPGGDGATAAHALSRWQRAPRVLVLTMHDEREHAVRLLEMGASGFLSKDAAADDLVEAVRLVAAGDVYVRPSVARLLASSFRPRPRAALADEARAKAATLSDRERTVLRLLAEGYSGVEIGRMLGVTAKTVDTYKHRVTGKIGLSHRAELVRFARRAGLVEAEPEQVPA